MKDISLSHLFLSFLKIGSIGFGGGSALIPVIEHEVVEKNQLVSKEEYDKNVVVANITPGALPVEISSGVGYVIAGFKGMFLATLGITLPGAILSVLLIFSYQKYGTLIQSYMKYPIAIISVYIIWILLRYIWKVILSYENNNKIKCLLVIGSVFFFSCGKEVTKLLSLDYSPHFDLSSIQIFLISFCVIFFLTRRFTVPRTLLICLLALFFVFSAGKSPLISNQLVEKAATIGLLLCAFDGIISSIRQGGNIVEESGRGKKIALTILAWIVFLVVLSLPIIILSGIKIPLLFEMRGLLSSVISFGGGDAYLTVADGLFVESGIVSDNQFYEILIPTVNIFPGSILCKTLSGIGFLYGFSIENSVLQGICMSLAGFGVSVFGSCLTFMLAYYLYDKLCGMSVIQGIAKWIRPVVSGLLMSIILSLALNIKLLL